jgi:hypothetical protein
MASPDPRFLAPDSWLLTPAVCRIANERMGGNGSFQ